MDIAHIPERFRARVLASIVRNARAGILIRIGKVQGSILPVCITQSRTPEQALSPTELENRVRKEFGGLPYELRVVTTA